MHTRTLYHSLLTAVSAVFLVSCATDVANRYYADRTYAPKDPARVQVLHREPGRSYKAIADFQSRGDTEESLRVKAARIGADAVIIVRPGGYYQTGQSWAGQDSLAGTSTRILGTAIVYK